MGKKRYDLLVDTETAITDQVADFAAVIVDRKGIIVNQIAVLVHPVFTNEELFYVPGASHGWTRNAAIGKKAAYTEMVQDGRRSIASVGAINRWLAKALAIYNPTVTAYNLSFDMDKCRKTGIDLDMFPESFCLWQAAISKWATTKKYRKFILDNHYFRPRTKHGNMTYITNAEVMAEFVIGHEIPPEPHTAFEDLIGYEVPILNRLRQLGKIDTTAFNWRNYQMKDNFKVK